MNERTSCYPAPESSENILQTSSERTRKTRNYTRSISDSQHAQTLKSFANEVSVPRQALSRLLARHGETAWTLSGQHTGLTDLPLTERGERNARGSQERLRGLTFAKVLPARCSVPGAPVSWLALEQSLKSTGFSRMELWRVRGSPC
jgi:hypothetical protein